MLELFTVENLIALLTLTTLEIVLGIDNIVFISIMADRLPKAQQSKARTTGLAIAMVTRILLLLIHQLDHPPDHASFHRFLARYFRPGSDPADRRLVPDRQEHPGDP